MKRPSFQFYPGDWTSNSNLRRCSHAEKGIWVDVLCLLHDQEEYGIVRWPLKEIAQAVNCTVAALRGLVSKGILKGADAPNSVDPFVYVPRSGRKDGDPVTLVHSQVGPIWYSSRMVKDEYVRTIRGESSRFSAGDGEAPKPQPKSAPKPPLGDGSSASSSSSPSGNEEPPIPPDGGLPEPIQAKTKKRSAIALQTFLDECKAKGEKPILKDDPVFKYADETGLPDEFLRLHWLEFKERYTAPDAKRYKDWRSVYRKSVRGCWFKLWYMRADGECGLTTQGEQAKRHHGKDLA